jgi:hypothetical protein
MPVANMNLWPIMKGRGAKGGPSSIWVEGVQEV